MVRDNFYFIVHNTQINVNVQTLKGIFKEL